MLRNSSRHNLGISFLTACLLVVATSIGVLQSTVAKVSAAESTRVISAGVLIAGVDLSNLTVSQAAQKLKSDLQTKLQTDLVVTVGKKTFTLTASKAKLKFDAFKSAERVYYAARKTTPTATPDSDGYTVPVKLALTHSGKAVKAFSNSVSSGVYVKARDAKIKITLKKIKKKPAKLGKALDSARLAKRVNKTLADLSKQRTLTAQTENVAPAVKTSDLPRKYPQIITVDRKNFRLRLFKNLKFKKRYPVAVGMAGLETPAGSYHIQDKQVNPAWHVPNSSWAGSLAGQTIPGGAPNNPLKARWMGLADGVGIHGTAERWSMGSRASHGCIRMLVEDVKDLYKRVKVGTPVLVK